MIAKIYLVCFFLLALVIGYGWYQDDKACEQKGGIYVRGLWHWFCVTPINLKSWEISNPLALLCEPITGNGAATCRQVMYP